jgi:hypothetical protein
LNRRNCCGVETLWYFWLVELGRGRGGLASRLAEAQLALAYNPVPTFGVHVLCSYLPCLFGFLRQDLAMQPRLALNL